MISSLLWRNKSRDPSPCHSKDVWHCFYFTEKTGDKIAFTAVLTPGKLSNLGAGQTIVFDKVITNFGDAYDKITGTFTAPKRGIYVFDMALMVDPGQRQYVEFVKDGQSIMLNYGQAVGLSIFISSSRTTTVELEKGNKVWIRTCNAASHGSGSVHGNKFSTFSGWLYASLWKSLSNW